MEVLVTNCEYLEQFKNNCAVFDPEAWKAAQEIDLNDPSEIRRLLPEYLKGIDPDRRNARFFPTFQAVLSARCGEEHLGVVSDLMYPESDIKGAPKAPTA